MRRTLVASTVAPLALAPGVMARVSDRTHRPKFEGLERAVQCFPGAMRPHERRPVNLGWDAAKPSAGVTYKIFMSAKAGGENFAKPNWTTGRLRFMTPKLPPDRYFVVRARNQAGKEDHNRVELRASNPCL
jgi:hypothetical protein